MKNRTFALMDLYNKQVLGHSAFRLYRLFLDIHNEANKPVTIKASRQTLMRLLGLSENALKSCIDELVLLRLITLKSDRPTVWQINKHDQFDEAELTRRVRTAYGEAVESDAITADNESKK